MQGKKLNIFNFRKLICLSFICFFSFRLSAVTKIKSLTLTGYGNDSYTEANTKLYIEDLKQLNANTASFLYTCHVKNRHSSKLKCHTSDTPSLKSLARSIKLARNEGMKVAFRFYVDLDDKEWRCHYNPENKKEFFDKYNDELLALGRFLEKRKVEIFIIGAELCKITGKDMYGYWSQSIKHLRKVYKGKITYGANWGEVDGVTEYSSLSFWNELDYIGIDHYLPYSSKLHINEILKLQKKEFKKYLDFAKSFNKEILITEVGVPGVENGNELPFEWRNKGKSDQVGQSLAYESIFKTIKSLKGISGVLVWRSLSSYESTYGDRSKELGYELWRRKAWFTLRNFFKTYN